MSKEEVKQETEAKVETVTKTDSKAKKEESKTIPLDLVIFKQSLQIGSEQISAISIDNKNQAERFAIAVDFEKQIVLVTEKRDRLVANGMENVAVKAATFIPLSNIALMSVFKR